MCAYPAIDYLLVGHIALDIAANHPRMGGTVAYAGLTAQRLGQRVGIVTRCDADLDYSPLKSITNLVQLESQATTTFENLYLPEQRQQYVRQQAEPIRLDDIPKQWHNASIIHLAPIMNELNPGMVASLPGPFKGLTAQGWLRSIDSQGEVHLAGWERLKPYLPEADAVIVSQEDIQGNMGQAAEMARFCPLVVVTHGAVGATVFWCGRRRQFDAPRVDQVDPTGAGDIFAAAFFIQVADGTSPWEAAEFANHLGADSVQRLGLESVPSPEWIEAIQTRQDR